LNPWTSSNINQGRQVHHVAPKSSIVVSEDTDIPADYNKDFPVDLALLEEGNTLSYVVGGITDLALTTGIEDAISDALAPKSDPVRLKRRPQIPSDDCSRSTSSRTCIY